MADSACRMWGKSPTNVDFIKFPVINPTQNEGKEYYISAVLNKKTNKLLTVRHALEPDKFTNSTHDESEVLKDFPVTIQLNQEQIEELKKRKPLHLTGQENIKRVPLKECAEKETLVNNYTIINGKNGKITGIMYGYSPSVPLKELKGFTLDNSNKIATFGTSGARCLINDQTIGVVSGGYKTDLEQVAFCVSR